jgi:hypothetical protein
MKRVVAHQPDSFPEIPLRIIQNRREGSMREQAIDLDAETRSRLRFHHSLAKTWNLEMLRVVADPSFPRVCDGERGSLYAF